MQLCSTMILRVYKTAGLINIFSGRSYCVETSYLICGAYLLIGFLAVGMSTDKGLVNFCSHELEVMFTDVTS